MFYVCFQKNPSHPTEAFHVWWWKLSWNTLVYSVEKRPCSWGLLSAAHNPGSDWAENGTIWRWSDLYSWHMYWIRDLWRAVVTAEVGWGMRGWNLGFAGVGGGGCKELRWVGRVPIALKSLLLGMGWGFSISTSSMRKDFHYLHLLDIEKLQKMEIYFHVSKNKLRT